MLRLTHHHPLRRAAGRIHGHGLHIGRPTDGLGYVAHCGCHGWGRWYADRRHAVLAYHRHLLTAGRQLLLRSAA